MTPAGSATVAVPPVTAWPDEPDELVLPPELQPAAINPTATTPATAARRSLRLHGFMWAPFVMPRTRVMSYRLLLSRCGSL